MDVLLLIVLGGLAGWVASMILHTSESMGILLNIIVGIAGAFIGSAIFGFFGAKGVSGFNLYSFLVALVGSLSLIALVRLFQNNSR